MNNRYENWLNYTKRKIKRTYKRYTGERTDETATIKDVADLFRVSVDEDRLDDYKIEKIDFDNLSIEIVDEKRNIKYDSKYTKENATTGFYAVERINSISVYATGTDIKRCMVYSITNSTPIFEKISIYKENMELLFRRTHSMYVDSFQPQDGNQLLIRYIENKEKEHNVLLQYEHKDGYKTKKMNSFDRIYVDEVTENMMQRPDCGIFNIQGDLVVSKKVHFYDDLGGYLEGACLEGISDLGIYEGLITPPGNRYLRDYPAVVDDPNIKSAFLFTYNTNKDGNVLSYELDVTKNSDEIKVNYRAIDKLKWDYKTKQFKVINNVGFTLDTVSSGKIQDVEVKALILNLLTKIDGPVIKHMVEEIENFDEQLQIKNGNIKEVLHPLSPKLLMNESFDKIADTVCAHKEEYFQLIDEQYREITQNLNVKGQKDSKVLSKTLNNQNNATTNK